MDNPRRSVQLSRSSSSAAYKKRNKVNIGIQKVNLERVIGLTANTNSQLSLDLATGSIAYTAGSVIVILGTNVQETIINSSRKAITALTFSADGRYIAVGESGHSPAVKVFEVSSKLQIAEFFGHKFGVTCVAFSPNGKYLISIGTQHDMVTNVWNWKQNCKVASNKISSKVNGLAFSEDGHMFVTIGVRHVKYWFLDESKRKTTIQNKNETVPLLGRNGLLGDQKTHVFVDVACGRGRMSDSIYVISQNGMLCLLTDRQISKTVELKTIRAYCINASESLIIIGCANGIIRVFDAETLQYIQTLHRPHPLGLDVVTNSMAVPWETETLKYPDTLGLVFDEHNMVLSVIYSDHSLYKWDLSRLPQIGKISSYLYHSSCVWSVDIFPELNILPDGTFITCSSDDTIRFWNLNPQSFVEVHSKKPSFNYELLKVVYTDPSLGSLCEQEYNSDKPDIYESRNGVKCIAISPDGRHLASGDLIGNVRVHDICTMSQIQLIEAHDAGVLCLEYSDFSTDQRYLVSASRDRLIHVYDAANDYNHLQTLSDHSSSICSVKLLQDNEGMSMISCGNDKSILFRSSSAETDNNFILRQNLMSKTTPHDMIVDTKKKYLATACQDRMIRLYNPLTGKHKRNYKGAMSDDGFLLKLTADRTGTLLAVSCSDKSIAILDFASGEIVSTLVGHSEVITGLKFTNDCTHLISVAADGCVFFWRLDENLIDRIYSSTLKRSGSDPLLRSKPDLTHGTGTGTGTGTSTGNLIIENAIELDEKTYTLDQPNVEPSDLPTWAKRADTPNRSKWDKDRATPVMTSIKNGQLHMSPGSTKIANGSKNIIPIAIQSEMSIAIDHDGEATDDDEDNKIFDDQRKARITKPNDLPVTSNYGLMNYKELPTPETIIYQKDMLNPSEDEGEFTVTHQLSRLEDEKSSTSDGASNLIESEEDLNHTPQSSSVSTPASSIPSTPMSPNAHLLDMLQQLRRVSAGGLVRVSPHRAAVTAATIQSKLQEQRPMKTTNGKPARKEMLQKNTKKQSDNSVLKTGSRQLHLPAGTSSQLYSSTESLTSTEYSSAGRDDSHKSNSSHQRYNDGERSSSESQGASFAEIDELCTSLRANLAKAQEIYEKLRNKDDTEKDYLVETLRDVCNAFHTMLPPTPQFEAIVHQTLHQFLHMNKDQRFLNGVGSAQNKPT